MQAPTKHKLISILKLSSVIAFVVAFIILVPDPQTKLTYIIKNESSKKIVLINTITGNKTVLETDAFIIDTDIKETSFNYIKNDLYKNKSYCTCYADSLSIVSLDSSLQLIKQINDNSDWEHFDEENLMDKGGLFVCRFLITDKDFSTKSK